MDTCCPRWQQQHVVLLLCRTQVIISLIYTCIQKRVCLWMCFVAGFMGSLVKAVWVALEDDSPVYTPRVWPVSVIDKYARKVSSLLYLLTQPLGHWIFHVLQPFARLVTMLSSFAAVNEIFGGKPLPAKDVYSYKEHPESIQVRLCVLCEARNIHHWCIYSAVLQDLFDRLVMVDTPSKICALFNYEQSHAFGLRLLAVMTSCLDTFLLLQTQYNIQAMLLRCQADNMLPDRWVICGEWFLFLCLFPFNKTLSYSKVIIIDMLSVERNYLLVKTYLMGGPNERVFPSREISAVSQSHILYIFSWVKYFMYFLMFPLGEGQSVEISTLCQLSRADRLPHQNHQQAIQARSVLLNHLSLPYWMPLI